MSLSCPENSHSGKPSILISIVGVMAFGVAAPVEAAQTFFQGGATLRVEQNTNRNLSANPDTEQDTMGYIADLEGTWYRATPTSEIRLRPRLRFQEYPDADEAETSEQFFDMLAWHRWTERSSWNFTGDYSRRDALNAEFAEAEFDPLDPDNLEGEDPGVGGDGQVVVTDDTRTRVRVVPGFRHDFTELTGLDLRAAYETVRYDSETRTDRSDIDDIRIEANIVRRVSPRTELVIGPYVGRFETRDDFNTTDSYGLSAGWNRRWSERFNTRLRLYVDHSEVELEEGATTNEETSDDFGGELAGIYRTETGRLRYSAGRRFLPTTDGNRSIVDEIRVQYDRDFSQRLTMRSAVRAYSREAQGVEARNDRDYARAELSLRWMMTPTFFVSGGYQYTWRDQEQDTGSAENHEAFISFGYQGLRPGR